MIEMTESQKFIHVSKYSRWIEAENRRELSWKETADRYLSFMRGKFGTVVPKKVWQTSEQHLYSLGVVPSMRAVATAGEALESNNILAYNCSFVPFGDLRAVWELFYILMCGTGVGFSVENHWTKQMPAVKRWNGDGAGVWVVEDSSEGWAKSLEAGLEAWFDGKDIEFDYSKIRPRGVRLRTKGGRASGPEPLMRLHTFCREQISKAQGRQLTSVEWLDIGNVIADVVIVGGVRRSSEICFSDLDDVTMREAKDWSKGIPGYRANSNNSAVYFTKPDAATFLREWGHLVESCAGERGIFNLHAAKQMLPERRKFSWEMRTNPCFAPGTLIQTKTGHYPIESLVGKTVDVWNGKSWQTIDNFRVTGENQPILKVTFRDGSEERVTPNHTVVLDGGQRIKAYELVPGMKIALSNAPDSHGHVLEPGAYLKGFLVADGTLTGGERPLLFLYPPKDMCQERLIASGNEIPVEEVNTNAISELGFAEASARKHMQGLAVRKSALAEWCGDNKKRLPANVFLWDLHSKLEFIAGVMDGDGTASDTKNGFMYQISSVHKRWLLDFQALLKTVKVQSRLGLMKKAAPKDFGSHGGVCQTQDCWRLTISQNSAIVLSTLAKFERLVSFANKTTTYRTKNRASEVVSVTEDGVEKNVYCCTVDGPHALGLTSGFYWGQCGEIILRPFQFCNLSEVIVRANDDFDKLVEKVGVAVWFGAMQASLTKFPLLRKEFEKNCKEEALLGVSLTGQMDNPKLMTPEKLAILKAFAIKTAKKASATLGINMAAAVTCGKPSGTVSQLTNAASGAHPTFAEYYIRRYRLNATDPCYRLMKTQGVKFSPENDQGPESIAEKRKALVAKGHSEASAKKLVPEWDESQVRTWVCEFPMAGPKGAITRSKVTAIDQLEWYLKVQKNWCEHNQSITVYVRDDEWLKVGAWIYDHFDEIVGVTCLPYSGGSYKQMPFEEITEEQYKEMVKKFPKLDWTVLPQFEHDDQTTGAQLLSCTAGNCEV